MPNIHKLINLPEVKSWLLKSPKWYHFKSEDSWGQNTLDTYKRLNGITFSNSRNSRNWSGDMGEISFGEILEKNGTVMRPNSKLLGNLNPDWETEDYFFEVKSKRFTKETANGKIEMNDMNNEFIFKTCFKYINIPTITKKPLFIVLCGFQEDCIREQDKHAVNFFCDYGINFLKCSDYKSFW